MEENGVAYKGHNCRKIPVVSKKKGKKMEEVNG